MSQSEFHVPSCEEIGEELIGGSDPDSLDAIEGVLIIEEEGLDFDETESLLDKLTDRELRITAIMSRIRNGEVFNTKLFGVEVEIKPKQANEPPPTRPDESGDREPRGPIKPLDVESVEAPVPADSLV